MEMLKSSALLQNIRNKELATQLIKTYSTIKEAYKSATFYENEKKNGYYKLMDNNEIQDFFNKNTRNISWTETWRFLFSYPEGISLIKNIYNNHSNPTQIYTHYLQVIDDAVAAIEYE